MRTRIRGRVCCLGRGVGGSHNPRVRRRRRACPRPLHLHKNSTVTTVGDRRSDGEATWRPGARVHQQLARRRCHELVGGRPGPSGARYGVVSVGYAEASLPSAWSRRQPRRRERPCELPRATRPPQPLPCTTRRRGRWCPTIPLRRRMRSLLATFAQSAPISAGRGITLQPGLVESPRHPAALLNRLPRTTDQDAGQTGAAG
jgi:hypothetical protein